MFRPSKVCAEAKDRAEPATQALNNPFTLATVSVQPQLRRHRVWFADPPQRPFFSYRSCVYQWQRLRYRLEVSSAATQTLEAAREHLSRVPQNVAVRAMHPNGYAFGLAEWGCWSLRFPLAAMPAHLPSDPCVVICECSTSLAQAVLWQLELSCMLVAAAVLMLYNFPSCHGRLGTCHQNVTGTYISTSSS